jgi:GH24 family phage-related lysozyme (muramidase)
MDTAAHHTREASSSHKEEVSKFFTEEGIRLIRWHTAPRTYNGFGRFSPYLTESGEYLIGYGSGELFGRPVRPFICGTREEIEEQFLKDLKPFAALVEHYVQMPLNEKKRSAVLSYAHSIGIPAFKECKLLQLINSRASKAEIIKEWSPYINRKEYYPENLRNRRREELHTYMAPDKEVPLLFEHKCKLNCCLATLCDDYQGTPKQLKAIEYLEGKIKDWDTTGSVMKRFYRLWSQEQGGLGSPKNL